MGRKDIKKGDKKLKFDNKTPTLFIMIMVVTIIILLYVGFRDIQRTYHKELEEIDFKLSDTIEHIDNIMDMSIKHLDIISQAFLVDHAYTDKELNALNNIKTIEDTDQFFYITENYEEASSLSGIGDISEYDLEKKVAILDALRLTPCFNIIKNNLKDIKWIYFVSKESFINLFPAVSLEDYLFTRGKMENDIYKLMVPGVVGNRQPSATNVYMDDGGNGAMITIKQPVYRNDEYLGTLYLDFTLEQINYLIRRNALNDTYFILVNNYNEILALNDDTQQPVEGLNIEQYLTSEGLDKGEIINLIKDGEFHKSGKYLIKTADSSIFPWQLIAIEKLSNTYMEIAKDQLILFSLIVLLIMTTLMYTKKINVSIKIFNEQLKFEQIIDQTVQLTAVLDLKGNILFVNKTAVSMIDAKTTELIGKPFFNTPWWNWSEELMEFMKDAVIRANHGENIKEDVINYDSKGAEHHLEFSLNPIYNNNGEVEYLAANGKNITDRIRLKESMDRLNKLDMLTNLGNRRAIMEKIDIETSRYNRTGSAFSILLCDVDNFKMINDTCGHNVGDEVLVALSQFLLKEVRSYDEVGRWGGEEFIIILPETEYTEAIKLGERICENIHNMNVGQMVDKNLKKITLTIGATEYNPVYDINTIIKQADDAMYYGKGNGKNQTVGYFEIIQPKA